MKITQLREREGAPALTTFTLDTFIEKIKKENNSQPVSIFREHLKYRLPNERYDSSYQLPKILPAIEFHKHQGSIKMKAYNGIVELSVGPLVGKSEIDLVKKCACEQPQTRCVFVGSSGQTVKIWTTFTLPDNTLPSTREDAEIFHAHAYRLAAKCYQPLLPFDIQPKEPQLEQYSRFSFDPEVIYRPDSVQFYLQQPTSMPEEMTYREAVQNEKSPLSRTIPGMSRNNSLMMQFEAALRKTFIDISVGDFQEITSDDRFKILVGRLAKNCFESGIPEEEAVRNTFYRYYAEQKEIVIREIFKTAYLKNRGFGKKSFMSKEQLLTFQTDEFMKRRYDFRYNTQIGEVEYRERATYLFRFHPIDKRVLNSIALDAQSEGIPLWDRDISRYIYSNRVPIFNPLDDYLSNLPRWDGKDRICELAKDVPCSNPYWPNLFHRWFLNMVAHWRSTDEKYANSVSPLLVGAQGTHKSTFCRNIMPPSERAYYTDSIDFSRKKDAELYLNRFALINIDEFDQISPTQQGFLKHILQKPVINVRKPYANAVKEMRRYASFIGTSNQKDLLTDPSGSRRFICIEVTGVINTTRPIYYDQLYAQAIDELNNRERYWFNQEEEKMMTEYNQEFEQVPLEEQLFYHYFRPVNENEEGEWLSPAEIIEYIHQHSSITISNKRISFFGRILQKNGIKSKRIRRGTMYCVVKTE